ncbi:MAG: histidine phosphotransferase family protein, partial [Alphaproteobacteria bacterium]|nr:histidine phosphotransferase family protein [Alphaproteobacteria bacterium]
LLEEGDVDFMDDIKSILKVSSQTLSARLKFFRMVFGLSNSNLEDVAIVTQTANDYLRTIGNKDYPLTLDFHVSGAEKCRIALLMIMILSDFLIRGGQIKVFEENNKIISQIEASARISKEKIDKIKATLSDQSLSYDAGLAPLLALLERKDNHKISLIEDAQYIKLIME